MILAAMFGIYGLFIGTIFLIINLCSINAFNTPYLAPFTPLDLYEQKDAILKINNKEKLKKRKKLLTKNIIRGKT